MSCLFGDQPSPHIKHKLYLKIAHFSMGYGKILSYFYNLITCVQTSNRLGTQ
jgi:hypothetical protein